MYMHLFNCGRYPFDPNYPNLNNTFIFYFIVVNRLEIQGIFAELFLLRERPAEKERIR